MIEEFQKKAFLRSTHLFRNLPEDELDILVEKMEEMTFGPGEVIIRQGDVGDRFYLVHSGRVAVTRRSSSRLINLAELVANDHFGEDALIHPIHRTATVTAREETVLFSLSRLDFQELIKKIPGLRAKFEATSSSHRLAHTIQFSWLEEGEIIYFITRKHQILLVKSLASPVLGLLLPVLSLFLYLLYPATGLFLWVAGLGLVGLGIWAFLKWLDWSNDYFIVTNRRVIFVEKVILLYDSRQEAPLTAILSVNTQMDLAGRTFGYGDVIIRTFVGNVVFKDIGYPQEVETLLREYWERTKRSSRDAGKEAMILTLRQKLGLAPLTPPPPSPKLATMPAYKFNLFKVRFEEKGIITYRKHWFVLLKQTWLPGLLALSVLGFVVSDLIRNGFSGRDTTLDTVLILLGFIPCVLWWFYQVIDWSNDKFQVTEDQIFDIDRTPFGRTQKNVAPLDNILNMEARREGLLEILFNYGNVYISVGGAQMVFEDVMNPDSVQQDIDQRRVARREKNERAKSDADRERLADYFATYHQNAPAIQSELESKRRQDQAGTQAVEEPQPGPD